MTRRTLLLVGGALAVALSFLFIGGYRVLERDREALVEGFAHNREQGIVEAARGLSADVADIGEDLDLASSLLQSANDKSGAERALHAIATIKREYLVMYARSDGETTKVTAFDAPTGVGSLADQTLNRLLEEAERNPGTLRASAQLTSTTSPTRWYRGFARRSTKPGPVVAVAVDTAVLLSRMKIQRDSMTRVLVLDGSHVPAAVSDGVLASLARDDPDAFTTTLASVAEGERSTVILDSDRARRIGLPETTAVAIGVPLHVDNGPPWVLLVVTSTETLSQQESTIVTRVVAGSALVLVLLLSAAAYVLHNAFRARTLRERVKHAERLAHLTEKAEKILDNIPSGVLALSADLHVNGINRWLSERLTGDIVGRPLEAAFPDGRSDDVTAIRSLATDAMRSAEARVLRCEKTTVLGQEATLNVHAVPLAHGVGDVSILLVFDDLTELRRIEHRLLHSEKLVTAGQLAAGIAHEIGTPLNVARGRVELSLSHLGDAHPEADNQRVVIDQIDRVTRLIQQLLDYVRAAPATIQDVALGQSLRVVTDLLTPQAQKRHVSLHVDVAADSRLHADPDQLQQLIVNLTLNSIDACGRGGNVWLRTKTRDKTVLLEITDDGQGIPVEIQKQIFDPFFTTKKRGQGTGLGLWVVAQLVRAQAGEIELESTLGSGTTVRIAWPSFS